MDVDSERFDRNVEFRIIYRDVKNPRLELRGSELWIILPIDADPSEVIKENRRWIARQLKFVEEARKLVPKLEVVPRTKKKFRALVKRIASEYSKLLNVTVNKVFIRKMKDAWASCSSKGNINVNRDAQYLPERILRYVVYHEICHLIRWRHDEEFHKLISKMFPDYDKLDLQLQAYWIKLKALGKIE